MLSRNTLLSLLALGACLSAAPAAQAQFYGWGNPDTNPVHWYVMGGVTEPVGNTGNLVQTGWNLGFGMAFTQANTPFSLRLEFQYSDMNATRQSLAQTSQGSGLQVSGGWSEVWTGTLNGEYRVPLSPGVWGYVVAGGGLYYNSVSLTENGFGYVCNPWWGYCYTAVGSYVVDSHSTTKLGWNAGAGVAFRLQGGTQLFVEARFNQMQLGQAFNYVPITVGLRW
jgi:opacity protein-like surface antigen